MALFVARDSCGYSASETFGFITTLYVPFFACMILRVLVQYIPLVAWFLAFETSILEPAARMALLLLFYIPVFTTYEMRFSMIRTVRQAS